MADAPPPAVFLSYASQDAAAARRLAESLRAAGVEVWFDQNELVGGDAWDQKIRRQIKECGLFVPLVSQNTEARLEGYFRLEWRLADQRTHLMAKGKTFLLPVAIDGTSEAGAHVPDSFVEVQWTRLCLGEISTIGVGTSEPGPDQAIEEFCARVARLLQIGTDADSVSPKRPTPPAERLPAKSTATARPRRSLLVRVAVVAVILAVAALVFWQSQKDDRTTSASRPLALPESRGASGATSAENSIAVLPFQAQSENKDDAYLADGIHEDVVTSLAGIRDLKIAARPSVLRYRGTAKPLPQIGEELGVVYLLAGSLRRAGNQIRVSAQLIEAKTERQIWAKSFDREFTNTLALQGDIAREIVPALHLTLKPDEVRAVQSAPTTSGSAYDLYLQARKVRDAEGGMGSSDRALLAQMEEMLKKAVVEDPRFIRAWVDLAATHTDRYFHDPEERNATRISRAEEAIATARRLAPTAPEVLLGQGRIRYYCYQDYPGAEYFYHRVLAEYPNYPGIHVNLGLLYRRQGRWAHAIVEFRRAVEIEPGNGFLAGNLVLAYLITRRIADAIPLQATLARARPHDPEAQAMARFSVFRQTGSTREYDEWWALIPEEKKETEPYRRIHRNWLANTGDAAGLREVLLQHGTSLELMEHLVVLNRRSDREALDRILAGLKPEIDRLLALDPHNASHLNPLGMYHALRGEKTEALKALEASAQFMPESRDAMNGPDKAADRAMILVWLGELDRAMAEVKRLLRKPGFLHVWMLQHRVGWAGLKAHPEWQRVVDDPANSAPLVTDADLAAAAMPAAGR